MISPGGSLMHSIGDAPKDVVESSLSAILEQQVESKYYLSQKACQGILRRSVSRGKELPASLRNALMRQAGQLEQA